MTRELRCPMRECRRRIDLDALPARAYAERDACMHFVAAWGGARGGMIEEVLAGLEGNREFVIRNIRNIRNIRTAELPPAGLELARPTLADPIARYAHVVAAEPEGGALFGDEFERDGLARALARLILGVEPIAGAGVGKLQRSEGAR